MTSSTELHSRSPCAAHSITASYSVAAAGQVMAIGASPLEPVPWQSCAPPDEQMELPPKHLPLASSPQHRTA